MTVCVLAGIVVVVVTVLLVGTVVVVVVPSMVVTAVVVPSIVVTSVVTLAGIVVTVGTVFVTAGCEPPRGCAGRPAKALVLMVTSCVYSGNSTTISARYFPSSGGY
jgi:hypothetical protein